MDTKKLCKKLGRTKVMEVLLTEECRYFSLFWIDLATAMRHQHPYTLCQECKHYRGSRED